MKLSKIRIGQALCVIGILILIFPLYTGIAFLAAGGILVVILPKGKEVEIK